MTKCEYCQKRQATVDARFTDDVCEECAQDAQDDNPNAQQVVEDETVLSSHP